MDDWGWDSGSYSYDDGGSYDYAPVDYDYGSWAPSDYQFTAPQFNTGTPDIFGSQGQYQSGSMADPSSTFNAGQMADPPASGGGLWNSIMGGGAGGGGASGGAGGGGAANPWLAAALGTAGPLAGLIGSLASGGQTGARMPQMGTAQVAQMNQANQAIQPFATGTTPLQGMQMSLLQALQNGQGLPSGYQQLIEQAFQPQMGDLYTQAANQGRARGFHDAPATSPPGGAILGPGLANIQGQMAQAKLGLMQSLPAIYNQPIQTAANAAANQSGNLLNAVRLGTGETNSVPMGAQIGTGLGSVLQGAAAGYGGQQQQQAQQGTNNRLMNIYESQLRNNSVNSSLSGTNSTPPYGTDWWMSQ